MKFVSFTIIFFITVSGFTQESYRNFFADVKINLTTASTPVYDVSNVKRVKSTSEKWLLINLEYTTGLSQKKLELTNKYMDGLTIQFELVYKGSSGNKSYYFSKQIDYLSVKYDGGKNYALVLLHPNTVNRIKYPIKKIKKTLNRFVVKVTFFLDGEKILEEYSPSSKSYIKLFNNIISYEKTVKLSDSLLNRLETPWNNLNYNRFELIKQ